MILYILNIFLPKPLGISVFPYNESIYFPVSVRRFFFKHTILKKTSVQTGFYIYLST